MTPDNLISLLVALFLVFTGGFAFGVRVGAKHERDTDTDEH